MILENTLLQRFESCQSDQLALCDELESIADSLPDGLDRENCLLAARAVLNVLARTRDFEESQLFPALAPASVGEMNDAGVNETLEHLRFEHVSDACFAEEVYEALMAMGRGTSTLPPAAAGYMLRGFFEGLRRHLAFERAFVLPALRRWNVAGRN
jgi:hypothetical protein